jgi:octaprenyl-diphosphate synthase
MRAIYYNPVVVQKTTKSLAASYQEVVSHFASDLEAIEKSLFSRLDSRNELLREITHYIVKSGGKRLRPLLVTLTSKINGPSGDDHILLGTVVEYLHAATLLHDDVIDKASLRRGSHSANAKWSNHSAVLGGDFLYTTAFDILLKSFPRDIIMILCRASLDMIEGEVLQRQWRGKTDLAEETYFEIISLKTASLIAASCESGGLLSGLPPERAKELYDFGRSLGTAFQIIDDTLDYTADEEKLGKVIGGDLRQGTVTLPLIYLLREEGLEELGEEIEAGIAGKGITDGMVQNVRRLIRERECEKRSMAQAAAHAVKAKDILSSFSESPVYPALSAAADFIIYRTH